MKKASVVLLSLLQLVMLVASQSVPATNISMPMKIDTHCHYVPPFYRDLLVSRNITSGGRPIPDWNASAHLDLDNELGIVTSVVSVSIPGAKLSSDDPVEEGRTLARQLNEYGKNLTMEYPKRFLFFATLTLPDVEGAVAEAIYALDTLNAAGVILEASTFGELLGTRLYDPLYKVLDERKTVVFIHPSESLCPEEPQVLPNSTGLPPYIVDFLLDTTRASLNLVYRNVTRDYPNIKFILAHSGGFLPFALTRAAGGLGLLSGQFSAQSAFLQELKIFNVDLALSATPYALPSTTAMFNATHITYGSDFPYAPIAGIQQNDMALQNFRLHSVSRKRIDYRNAYGFFEKFLK